MIIQDFYEKIKNKINIIAIDSKYDEQSLLEICNVTGQFEINSIIVSPEYVEKVWKWVEKTGVKIGTIINANLPEGTEYQVFSEIKASIDNGAEVIELILPFDDFHKIEAIYDLIRPLMVKNKKIDFKFILETGEIEYTYNSKEFFNYMIDLGIKSFKTASGKCALSTIEESNSLFDEVKNQDLKDITIDSFVKFLSIDGFYNLESVYRLSNLILGEVFLENNTFYSITFDDFKRYFVNNMS